MTILYQVLAPVRDAVRTTNLAVIIGAAFFLISILLTLLFLGHEKQTQQMELAIKEGRLATTKMLYFSELSDYARERTRLTSQILDTDDVFEQDEINQELESFAGKYAAVYQALKALPLDDAENEVINRQDLIVPVILPAQREAVSLAMDGDNLSRKQAKEILYQIVFPGQNKLIELFHDAILLQQKFIEELAINSKLSLDMTENRHTMLAGFIVFFTIIIAGLVIRRAHDIQSRLEQSQVLLEKKVSERTAELEVSRDKAERSSQAKSEFLSSMSHELRTPMNAILGFAQLLEFDKVLAEEQQDSVQEILKAGYHLLELINEVLDLAKIESGHIDLLLEPVKLSALVNECFSLVTPAAENRGISLRSADVNGYTIRADRTRLKQVLLNLLSNAIKYNREQGSVKLEAQTVNETSLRISISDTGNGIAKGRFDLLFQPFNRLNAEGGEIEGTGIGLAITRNLVEMMGGHVGVDSEQGVGSRFWIELPQESFEAPVEQDIGEEYSANDIVGVAEQLHTVLYIEDNLANLKLVSQILVKRQHINLITAHEPELGLELAVSHLPELILLDINMPRMDGYQVLSLLQLDERLKHIPVVAITANAMTQDVERGKKAGFSDYLTKPLDVSCFLATIDHYLNVTKELSK
ncbi:MAG: ATP-binding protein [Pseudomonadota bacterium]